MAMFGKLLRDNRGVGAIEYSLVAMLISIAAVSAYANLGSSIQARWSTTSTSVAKTLG
jgi:Flp pilus assembly pilin Flp